MGLGAPRSCISQSDKKAIVTVTRHQAGKQVGQVSHPGGRKILVHYVHVQKLLYMQVKLQLCGLPAVQVQCYSTVFLALF